MATNNMVNVSLSNQTGTGSFVGSNSPVLTNPNGGVMTATSINFGGSALSTYAEGTFTPTATFATVGDLSVSYSAQNGYYTRVGNILNIRISITFTPTFITASGALRIVMGTMPYTSTRDFGGAINIFTATAAYPAGVTQVMPVYRNGTNYMELVGMGSATSTTTLGALQFLTTVASSLGLDITMQII